MRQFTAKEFIMIDIANHFGLDKEVWDIRIQWVKDNELNLEALAEDADKPLLYGKAVRSYRMVQNKQPTNIPVSLDSTWSGGQIMAVLMHCDATAKASNLFDIGRRADVYTELQTKMNSNFGLNHSRQDIKDCFMPYWYGSSEKPKQVFGDGTDAHKAFLEAMDTGFPGAVRCRELTINTWNSKATSHDWMRDDMSFVTCPVMIQNKKRISCGKTSFTHIAYQPGTKDTGVANSANFIQSLDAMIMARMIMMAKSQGYELYGVHDSFFCHPNHMQKTRENYLSILMDLASKPVMVQWLNHMMPNKNFVSKPAKVVNAFLQKLSKSEYHLS